MTKTVLSYHLPNHLDSTYLKMLCLIRSQPTTIRKLSKFIDRVHSVTYARLKRLKSGGYVEKKGSGPYTLTDMGIAVVREYSLSWGNDRKIATLGKVELR